MNEQLGRCKKEHLGKWLARNRKKNPALCAMKKWQNNFACRWKQSRKGGGN